MLRGNTFHINSPSTDKLSAATTQHSRAPFPRCDALQNAKARRPTVRFANDARLLFNDTTSHQTPPANLLQISLNRLL
jgi:anti-sigma-K factor RskA